MRESVWSAVLAIVICCSIGALVCEKPACAQRKGEDMSTEQEFLKAVTEGDAGKVRELLKKNPSLAKAKGQDGVSALLQAVYRGRGPVISLLLASGIELDIFEAAATGRAERVRALLKLKPDLANAFAPDGFTPLGLAAFFGHEEAVKVLLDGGAEVNGGRWPPGHREAAYRTRRRRQRTRRGRANASARGRGRGPNRVR